MDIPPSRGTLAAVGHPQRPSVDAQTPDDHREVEVNGSLSAAAPLKLPVTLSTHPKDKPRLGLAFTYEGESWTVTASYWRGQPLYRLSYRADGLGDWREVTADELTAMLEGAEALGG